MSSRYHSLSADVGTIPVDVAITGAMKDSGVMGVGHHKYMLETAVLAGEILSETTTSSANLRSQMLASLKKIPIVKAWLHSRLNS